MKLQVGGVTGRLTSSRMNTISSWCADIGANAVWVQYQVVDKAFTLQHLNECL